MHTFEELDELSLAVRDLEIAVDDELVKIVEEDIKAYLDVRGKLKGDGAEDLFEPPDYLWDRLWSMGWLIYEASLRITREIKPHDRSAAALEAASLAKRLYEAASKLPWGHFAPRALGATRAYALVASKENTELGFAQAVDLHGHARERHDSFKSTHGEKDGRALFMLGLQEMMLQLVLAETGTTCRAAERLISRWAEGLVPGLLEELEVTAARANTTSGSLDSTAISPGDSDEQHESPAVPQWTPENEDDRAEVMFADLVNGVEIGKDALDIAGRIDREYGFVDKPSRERMAMPTAFRNPGIMTARAALLVLALSWEMELIQPRPIGDDHEDWAAFRTDMMAAFLRGYQAIERPIKDDKISEEHKRALVQIRLNAAVLLPGLDLPSQLNFASCLEANPLDEAAVEGMSAWLAEPANGQERRGDANAIGSATMPIFLAGVRKCRADRGVADGYEHWRRRWFTLDRHLTEQGREQVVSNALDDAHDDGHRV